MDELSRLRERVAELERWREALVDVLDLKNHICEELDDIKIDRVPAHARGPAHEEHEPGEWIAWNAEYPEDGSLSLKMLASPPHMGQVKADDELCAEIDSLRAKLRAADPALPPSEKERAATLRCNCPDAIHGVTDEPCPVHGGKPASPRAPSPRRTR